MLTTLVTAGPVDTIKYDVGSQQLTSIKITASTAYKVAFTAVAVVVNFLRLHTRLTNGWGAT
jgi:hypothetical protein